MGVKFYEALLHYNREDLGEGPGTRTPLLTDFYMGDLLGHTPPPPCSQLNNYPKIICEMDGG